MSGTTITADDVFEMAERIELNSGRFYLRASELAGFGALASQLRELAEMEHLHAKTFAEMRMRLADANEATLPLAGDDETVAYLTSLVRGKSFSPEADPLKILAGVGSPQDVLLAGIGFEKEAIAFYAGVKQVVAERDRAVVDRIIAEEMSHIAVLSRQLSAMAAM